MVKKIADEHGGVRVVGSAGYDASVDYAASTLREIGFEVTTPEVAYTGFRELAGGLLEVGRLARGEQDLGAGLAERLGDLQAEPAGAAGDQRGAAGEVEELEDRGAHGDGVPCGSPGPSRDGAPVRWGAWLSAMVADAFMTSVRSPPADSV